MDAGTMFRDLRVLVTRSDVPGQWVSHCLDIDVVSQGGSIDDAMEMLREAVAICVEDDLGEGEGLPLEGRRRAPSEYLETWGEIMKNGRPLGDVDPARVQAVASLLRVQLDLVVVPIRPDTPKRLGRPSAESPAFACM